MLDLRDALEVFCRYQQVIGDAFVWDLETIAECCREVGSALVLDLTQSAGALPFAIDRVQPDFVVCATYKWLLGPYTLGFLYVAPHWQQGQPLEYNWIARLGSEDFTGLVCRNRAHGTQKTMVDPGRIAPRSAGRCNRPLSARLILT